MNATGEMIVLSAIAFAAVCLIALIVVIAVVITKACKNKKKKVAPARTLSIEEKIMILNNRLATGTITKETYDAQKAALLKNI